MKKFLYNLLVIAVLFQSAGAQNIQWEERFDSLNFFERGWSLINNDSSASLPGLFSSFSFVDLGELNPKEGNYFFKFGFDDASHKDRIDDWLITPRFMNVKDGDSISFWCGAIDGNFKDSLRIWISVTDSLLTSFEMIDQFKVNGPTGMWHQKSYDLSKYSGKNIFFSVNYYLRNAGPLGSSSDNVWIDHFVYTSESVPLEIPTRFELNQNFPNPFNPATDVIFKVASRTNVLIKIYNTAGKEMLTAVDKVYEPGVYRIKINAANFPSGVYFYKMTAGEFSDTKKMEVIK